MAAANLNIALFYPELPPSTKGVCYEVSGRKIILINSNLDENEKRYVCAHELGHAILHPKLNYSFLATETLFSPQKIEREADIFASELLISDDTFSLSEFEHMSYKQIASFLLVPEHLVMLKAQK